MSDAEYRRRLRQGHGHHLTVAHNFGEPHASWLKTLAKMRRISPLNALKEMIEDAADRAKLPGR